MVAFFCEDIDFSPPSPNKLSQWITQVILCEDKRVGNINYVYCSKSFLLHLNQSYLDHQDHTDVITFDQSDTPGTISADIYISVDQVRENAEVYGESFDQELKRVMVHGVLHLLGYNDKTPQQRHEMRKKEEAYLSL